MGKMVLREKVKSWLGVGELQREMKIKRGGVGGQMTENMNLEHQGTKVVARLTLKDRDGQERGWERERMCLR